MKPRFIPQMEASECGAASLAMVLAHHGYHAPLDEIRNACGIGRDGTSAGTVLQVARSHGLEAGAYRMEVEDLRFVPLPAILHWQFNHFLVLSGWRGRKAILLDPAIGESLVSLDLLRTSFTGVALVFRPGPTFRTRARRPPSLARYGALAWCHRNALAQVLAGSAILQALGLGLPLGQKFLVDAVMVARQEALLWGLAGWIGGSLLARSLMTLARAWVLHGLQVLLDLHLLGGFIAHLLRLPLAFFIQRPDGDLLQRVDSNSEIQHLITEKTLSAMLDGLLLVGYVAIMVAYCMPLGLAVLGLGLVRLFFQGMCHRANTQLMAAELSTSGKAHAILAECLGCLEAVKAAGAEGILLRKWAGGQAAALNASRKRHLFQARQEVLMAFLATLGQVVVFLLAGREVLAQRMTVGTFSAFLLLQGLFLAPLASFLDSLLHIQFLGSHLARLDDILETHPESTGSQDPGYLTGDIQLQGVVFAYPGTAGSRVGPIDLVVRAGEKIALVGPVGAGKSTLARLLLGMHVPREGSLRFDGRDIRDLDLVRLRKQMGIVLQETFLLNDTVRGNLTINDENLPLSRLQEAARIACILDDIEALPQGFDTPIGENGAILSGGQRQRLSLARALAHGPTILLMDEATSSLDVETEARVHHNLATLKCTRLVVAHRLATIRDADRILVLDQGRLVQEGDFRMLQKIDGPFSRLFPVKETAFG